MGAGAGGRGSTLTPRFLTRRRQGARASVECPARDRCSPLLSASLSFRLDKRGDGAQCCLSSLGRSLGHSAPAAGRGPLCGPGRGISKHGADATSACSAASPSRRPSTCPVWGAQRRRVPGPGRSPREPCPDYMRRRKGTKVGSPRAVLGGSRTSFRDTSSSSLNFRVCF